MNKFTKPLTFKVEQTKILNDPHWSEYNMTKFASIKKDKDIDFGGFDLTAAIKNNPEHLFIKIFAIKENEVNDNGDYFCAEELKKSAHTFIGVPIFTNHQNTDIEKAKGNCVHSWYDGNKGGIYIIAKIDRVAYPQIARGISEKYVIATSMGCSVSASNCSICHNQSAVAEDYCDHIKGQKNRKVSGKYECRYHESKCKPTDDCPICGKKKNENKTFELKEAHVFEHNYGLKFIEDSLVVNPACHDCLIEDVFNKDGFLKKVADLKDRVTKCTSVYSCPTGAGALTKVAGKLEIDDLNEAMDKIERVAKSMMAQKQSVSMEYVADLVDTLAKVQSVTDELIEMGYVQLPSPSNDLINSSKLPDKTLDINKPTNSTPNTMPQMAQTFQPTPTPMPVSNSGDASTESIGNLGTITRPKAASKNIENKIEEFIKVSENLINRLSEVTLNNNFNVKNGNNIKESSKMANENTSIEKTASEITEKQLDNAKFTGERVGDAPNVITEKQLDKPKDVNVTTSQSPQERTGSYDSITEKQLTSVKSGYITRWDEFPNVVTEKQWTDLSRLIGSELSKDQSNIISEKQLNDFISKGKYVSPTVITEKQLTDQNSPIGRQASAKDIVKVASDIIADAIANFNHTPSDIVKAASFITENSKSFEKAAFLTFVNALPHKAEARRSEVEKYKYFSKIASANAPSAVDSLIISIAENIGTMEIGEVINTVKKTASSEIGMKYAEKLAKVKMSSSSVVEKVASKEQEIDNAINGLLDPSGTYEVRASFEDINVDINKKKAFTVAAYKFANTQINDPAIKTALTDLTIDTDNKLVIATLKDIDMLSETEKAHWSKIAQQFDMDKFNKENPEEIPVEDEFVNENPLDESGLEDEDELEGGLTPEDKNPFYVNEEGELEEEETEGDIMDNISSDRRRASREAVVKTAQMLGGEIGGQAGASTGPGAGATLPTPPNAGAAPAPLESFEKSDIGNELGADEGADEFAPKPPGAFCPVCKSDDVDTIKGESKCNNCTSEWNVKIIYDIKKFKGVTGDNEGEKTEEETPKGEGFELPTESATPPAAAPAPAPAPMPAAASSKNNDKQIKLAEMLSFKPDGYAVAFKIKREALEKAKGIKLGSVSPYTGSVNTKKLENGNFVCLDTGKEYSLDVRVRKDSPKDIYAQLVFASEDAPCSNCARAKEEFINALGKMNISEEQFDSMDLNAKAETIIKLKQAGSLKTIKTASVEKVSVLSELKRVMASTKDFPMETCLEKLARRFGENAVALSGPCEGKPLADCVCKSLKSASVYSNGLAVKVASIWADKEASMECLEDFVREGYDLKEASTVCEQMKYKYAAIDDMVAEELEENFNGNPDGGEKIEHPEVEVEIDPFDNEDGMENEEVTISLPKDVIEKLDAAFDVALGENPAEEEHHVNAEPLTDSNEVEVEVGESGPVEVTVENPEEEVEVSEPINPSAEDNADKMAIESVEKDEKDITKEQKENLPEGLAKAIEAKENKEVGEEEVEIEVENDEEKPEVEVEVKENEDNDEEVEVEIEDEEKNNEEKDENKEGENSEDVEQEEKTEELADEGETFKEGEDEEKFAQEANSMKKGNISKVNECHLNLDNVLKVLEAGKLKTSPAQDNVPFTYQNGKVMGDENKFDADKPNVPSKGDKSKIGNEEPVKADNADIPTSDARMGGEKGNKDLTPELDDTSTGGVNGEGSSKSAKTSDGISRLADAISAQLNKAAQNKVTRKQVQDDKDLGNISNKNKSYIGNEKESIGEVPAAKTPTEVAPKGKGSLMGDEKNIEVDEVNIPTNDARMNGEKDNDKIKPEKDTEMTGNVRNVVNAKTEIRNEAFRIAGRMLKSDMIKAEQLMSKVAELERYEVAQLKDLEKGMFSTSKKGLTTAKTGLEGAPVLIKEASFKRQDTKAELVSAVKELFSLNTRNELAQQDTDFQTRQMYK